MILIVVAAAAVSAAVAPKQEGRPFGAQPGRDPTLLHRRIEGLVAEKEREQEEMLRRLLALGGSDTEAAEVTARLANLLRARGLRLAIRAQAESDTVAAERDRAAAAQARAEAIARYRDLLQKYPRAQRQDEALFFFADTLQDSGRDAEAVAAARELTRRFPHSTWAPASHVFVGEHLFDEGRIAEALAEYRAAAAVETDEVYPYALYKAAWCRFNQGAFTDAMKLLHQVVAVSLGGDATRPRESDAKKVQLAREARRDYVLAYSRAGKPEAARAEFAKLFGPEAGLKMLEQYARLLFDTGQDVEAQLVCRQLLQIHGDEPAATLDQTRLLVLAARSGKRRALLIEAPALVETFRRVRERASATPTSNPSSNSTPTATPGQAALAEAERLAEETLRDLAVSTHAEARKTLLDETFAAARALYADYLTLFPDAPEAYELRFFDAELLYGLGEKPEAAALYEAVVRQDLAAAKAHRKRGRWTEKAAWGAVLARDEAARESAPQPKSRQQNPQRALTPQEDLLARACLLYLEALPQGPHAVDVAFKVGRVEYLRGALDDAEKHLSWIAVAHPEHELAEYAANLVLDIANLRKDFQSVRAWALRFLGDQRLLAHGALAMDLRRVEEESAYALAEAVSPDPRKAQALLAFADEHPRGALFEKALFAAAAALSRAGKVDDALAARARLAQERPASPLFPRALLASASDRVAVGDLGEGAALLERYAHGHQMQRRGARPAQDGERSRPDPARYEEAKAQAALHDAALLREARGELRLALQDRAAASDLWPHAGDRAENALSIALLRARLGERARAARELAALGRSVHGKHALKIACWREAARLFGELGEAGHATFAWSELSRTWRALDSAARDRLPSEAKAAAAEAHLALGERTFREFKAQRIEPPLLRTLNRKVALLRLVKKRAEQTVAMQEAGPAVCALSQLGEAQLILAQAIAQSAAPSGLTAEGRKLYRAALQEKAQPVFAEAKETLQSAEAKARQLGVNSACSGRVVALLHRQGVKAAPRARPLPAMRFSAPPDLVDADGRRIAAEATVFAAQVSAQADQLRAGTAQVPVAEKARRLLDEAILAAQATERLELDGDLVARFDAAAGAAPRFGPALFDRAVALDRAGRPEAEGPGLQLAFAAAERAAALAILRGDARAAAAVAHALEEAFPDEAAPLVLAAQVQLEVGDLASAQAAARSALARKPGDVDALIALARIHLTRGSAGTARLLALRAAQGAADDARPLLVQAEVALASGDEAAEIALAKAAVAKDPGSAEAALLLGRTLFEHDQRGDAVQELLRAVRLSPRVAAARLSLGAALAARGENAAAERELALAARLAPRAAEPHLELARFQLEGKGDAKAALEEAKLFLELAPREPPRDHPIHGILRRCEEALRARTQASVVQ